MKGFRIYDGTRFLILLLCPAFILTSASGLRAQTTTTDANSTPAAAAAMTENEAVQRRLARARALAAVGKLAAAASDLEALRAASTDESVRDVTRVVLMSIFVEMPDYQRAHALLEEAFKARPAAQPDAAATHSFYALAGQTINGVRTHIERYRSFGINIADDDLPAEANSDLDHLRSLVERVVANAKAIRDEQGVGGSASKGQDATALLEDAASVRLRLARHEQDRARWQTEVSDARQRLFASETRIASISQLPAARPPATPGSANAPTGGNTAGGQSDRSAPQKQSSSAPRQPAPRQPAPPQQSSPAPASSASTTSSAAQNDVGAVAAPDAAAKSATGAPIAVGSLAGKAKQKYSPTYPSIARAARVSGIVTVYLLVNENGVVESVQRADGPVQLQQAAMDAARRWRFNQTLVNGQPMRVVGYLSFNFAL
ncbi:MAG: energy transducer TonB [Acidobacteria bacterium]|nr:energy transducer TonB [Acidobacteriota bacterium]